METDQRKIPLGLEWAADGERRIRPYTPGKGLTFSERRGLLLLVDLCLINTALLIALILWSDYRLTLALLLANAKWFFTLSAVWIAFGLALDVYNPMRAASTLYTITTGGLAALVAALVYQAIPWLTPPPARRAFSFGLGGLMILGIAAWRAFYAQFLCHTDFQRRVLLVGTDATAKRMAAALEAAADAARANPFRGTGYQIVDTVETLPGDDAETLDPAHVLVRHIRTLRVDEILVAEQDPNFPTFHEVLLDCRELGICVTPLSTAYERLTARLPVEYAAYDLSLVADAEDSPARRLYGVAKRLLDVSLSLVGLAVMGLLTPWIALGNALTSPPGPLFYRQERVGRGGRPFALYKFRTMRPHAEENGAVWASDNDPRVTPVGRWLRRMRIDELPQCINVLKGEMSVVGPRPERPEFVGEISRVLPIYRARHAVRPGITGWAQIRYHYGSSVEDARVKLEYDLYYIKHAGFFQDIVILLQTLPVIARLEGL